jgi:hypothetical protein
MKPKVLNFVKKSVESFKKWILPQDEKEEEIPTPKVHYWEACEIANVLIICAEVENRRISNLDLNRLVILAHSFYLAFEGKPLCSENVTSKILETHESHYFPSLRKACARFGSGYVSYLIEYSTPEVETKEWQITAAVYTAFKKYNSRQLIDTLLPIKRGSRSFIPDSILKTYFEEKLRKGEKQEQTQRTTSSQRRVNPNPEYQLQPLYRKLVKLTHPDSPQKLPNGPAYWNKIHAAYKEKNVRTLQEILQTLEAFQTQKAA